MNYWLNVVQKRQEEIKSLTTQFFYYYNNPLGMHMRFGHTRLSWEESIAAINSASHAVFPDQPFDVSTPPVIDNQFRKVPGEADNLTQDQAWEFRKFYYHQKKVADDTQELFSKLKQERDQIWGIIAKDPTSKFLFFHQN